MKTTAPSRRWTWAGVLAAVCLVAGCGKSAPASGTRPAETAEKAVRAFLQGMKNCDEYAMLACGKADDEDGDAICALAEFGRAAGKFRVAFLKAYGQEAWERFNDRAHTPGETNAHLQLLEHSVDEMMSGVDLRIQGPDVATFTVPNETRRSRIVKVEEGWLVDVRSLLPKQMESAKFAELMNYMADAVGAHQEAIGRPGIRPDDIDVELGRAIMERLLETEFGGPHRYDVDDL